MLITVPPTGAATSPKQPPAASPQPPPPGHAAAQAPIAHRGRGGAHAHQVSCQGGTIANAGMTRGRKVTGDDTPDAGPAGGQAAWAVHERLPDRRRYVGWSVGHGNWFPARCRSPSALVADAVRIGRFGLQSGVLDSEAIVQQAPGRGQHCGEISIRLKRQVHRGNLHARG